jgi:tetratricopeptide (TPR) repeat protein/DNA-binding SARP family transcriptional activator
MATAPEFGVLGPLVVRGAVVPVPRSPVLRRLLGILLVAEGSPVGVPRLTRLVWGPNRAAEVRPGSVHVATSRLRAWLARAAPDSTDVVRVEHDPAGYRLVVPPQLVDVCRFRRLVGEAAAAGDPARALPLLAEAIGLRRGPVLADLDVDREAAPLGPVTELVRTGLVAFCDVAADVGDPAAALPALERLAEEDPLDETVHARLITTLGAAGRVTDAVRAFERVRQQLSAELGVGPGRALRRAHESVLATDRPPVPSIRPGLLPATVPDFVGRGPELARVLDALGVDRPATDPATRTRIVAVTGRAGLGKTSLAVHAAHGTRSRFPDGQLYAQLNGAGPQPADPGQVLARFLRAMGVADQRIPTDVTERSELYRDLLAERRVLVVLDDAAGEAQVRPLVPGGAGCAVLITARRRLPVQGATSLELDVLDDGTAAELLARIVGADRAAAQADRVGDLVRLCGGVPLALRIAGGRLARLPHRDVGWLVERLTDDRRRLDELVLDDLEIRAGLGSSYRALPEQSRTLFRRLGLLEAPDLASWAAAGLIGESVARTEDLLDTLVDAMLVDIAGVDAAHQTRYRLHDLIRVYALELAEAEEPAVERDAAVARALDAWYAAAHQASRRFGHRFPAVPGPAPDAAPRPLVPDPAGWFEAERAALVAGVRQAYDIGLDELCWRLAGCLDEFLESVGGYDEWAGVHATALAAARRAGSRTGEARIQFGLGELATDQDRCSDALRHFDAGLEAVADLDDPLTEAHLRRAAGVAARMVGQIQRARADLEVAAAAFQALDHRHGLAATAQGLGAIHREQGRLADAAECFGTALAAFEELGDDFTVAGVLCSLGNVHRLSGRPDEADVCLRRGLEISRRIGSQVMEALALAYLGELRLATGDLTASRDLLTRARDLSAEIDEQFGLGLALHGLGRVQSAAGDHASAETTLAQALEIWDRIEAPLWRARTLHTLGDTLRVAGHAERAVTVWQEARTIFETLDAPEAADLAERLKTG